MADAARAAEIAARDMAEWFVPIGPEGVLPGATNRDQSVLGQMGLMFLGIGVISTITSSKSLTLSLQFHAREQA